MGGLCFILGILLACGVVYAGLSAKAPEQMCIRDREIVRRAQQRAAEILSTAQEQAKEINRSATTYC